MGGRKGRRPECVGSDANNLERRCSSFSAISSLERAMPCSKIPKSLASHEESIRDTLLPQLKSKGLLEES